MADDRDFNTRLKDECDRIAASQAFRFGLAAVLGVGLYMLLRIDGLLVYFIPRIAAILVAYGLVQPRVWDTAGKVIRHLRTDVYPDLRKGMKQRWEKRNEILADEDKLFKYLTYGILGLIVCGLSVVLGSSVLILPFIGGAEEAERWKFFAEMLKFAATALVGGVAFVGIYYTHKRMMATDRQHALEQRAQYSERFVRAVELLGKHGEKELDLRLGGIYALGSVARESEKDHAAVMEVLCTYVCEHTRQTVEAWEEWGKTVADWYEKNKGKDPWYRSALQTPGPASDIQAILTVFSEREQKHEKLEMDEYLIFLPKADLRGLNLISFKLGKIYLAEAHLEGAYLQIAHMVGACLQDTHLEGANLEGANLEGANLAGAHLVGTNLDRAHLEGASLQWAHMERVTLQWAHLEGANLDGAYLKWARLDRAYLEKANLGWGHLEGASLRGANLGKATLYHADLKGVEDLTQEQIDSTYYDADTTLPDNLINRAAGHRWPIEWNPTLNSGKGGLWNSETKQPVEYPPPYVVSGATGGDSPGPEDLKTAVGEGSPDPGDHRAEPGNESAGPGDVSPDSGNKNSGPGNNPPGPGNDSAAPGKNPPKPPKGPKSGRSKVGNTGNKSPKSNKSKKEG